MHVARVLIRLYLYLWEILMRVRVTNAIIDDSDSKLVDCDRNFSPIQNPTTDLSWQLRFRSNLNHFQSEFDLFRLKDRFRDWKSWINDRKIRLKDWKSQLHDQKIDFYPKSWSNLIYFDYFFDINWILRSIYGPNSNGIIVKSKSDGWNRIKKVD